MNVNPNVNQIKDSSVFQFESLNDGVIDSNKISKLSNQIMAAKANSNFRKSDVIELRDSLQGKMKQLETENQGFFVRLKAFFSPVFRAKLHEKSDQIEKLTYLHNVLEDMLKPPPRPDDVGELRPQEHSMPKKNDTNYIDMHIARSKFKTKSGKILGSQSDIPIPAPPPQPPINIKSERLPTVETTTDNSPRPQKATVKPKVSEGQADLQAELAKRLAERKKIE